MKLSHFLAALLAVMVIDSEKRKYQRMTRRRRAQILRNREAILAKQKAAQHGAF